MIIIDDIDLAISQAQQLAMQHKMPYHVRYDHDDDHYNVVAAEMPLSDCHNVLYLVRPNGQALQL